VSTPAGIGIDGCSGGWAAVVVDDVGARLHLLRGIGALDPLLLAAGADARVLVDIPVGLPVAGEREVDVAARTLLGPRTGSVFGIPPRPVLDALDYPEALALARAAMGKGLSKQAFHLLPKIREVDRWLRRRGGAVPLRESHPELVFRGLARLARRDADALGAKRTAPGRRARLAVLADHGVDGAALLAAPRREKGLAAAEDDVLDAAALAVAARLPAAALATVPAVPATDPLGLPMEMLIPAAALD
jgi:predicted RNase H-like nuclease